MSHVTGEGKDVTAVIEHYVQMCFSPEVRTDTLTKTILSCPTKYQKCNKRMGLMMNLHFHHVIHRHLEQQVKP